MRINITKNVLSTRIPIIMYFRGLIQDICNRECTQYQEIPITIYFIGLLQYSLNRNVPCRIPLVQPKTMYLSNSFSTRILIAMYFTRLMQYNFNKECTQFKNRINRIQLDLNIGYLIQK